MNLKYYILFREDKIYITTNKRVDLEEYSLANLMKYPNVPRYTSVFHNEKAIKELKELVKNKFRKEKFIESFLSKDEIALLMPDDVTEIEKRAFHDLIVEIFRNDRIIFGSECAFVAPDEQKKYVCVSKTCRMIILTYMKDKKIFKQKFIEDKSYTNEELKELICDLCEEKVDIPKIFLNGEKLSAYADLGKVVEHEEILRTLEEKLEKVKIRY